MTAYRPNLQPVQHREGQLIQCASCLQMKPKVWADLNGQPFVAYICADCKPAFEQLHKD